MDIESAVLEFQTRLAGLTINGVDIISWNSEDRINRFKVMIRPLRAINAVHQAMGQQLAASSPRAEDAAQRVTTAHWAKTRVRVPRYFLILEAWGHWAAGSSLVKSVRKKLRHCAVSCVQSRSDKKLFHPARLKTNGPFT
jgi:hypothetical protein